MLISPFSLEEIKNIPAFEMQQLQFIEASDGVPLAYYPFETETEPKEAVIFYHGGGLYNNRTYQWVGLNLRKKYSIATYMADIRGHGHSGGERGDAPSIEQVYKDIDSLINLVKTKHPNIKIYLAGHSSGAGLILNYSQYNKSSGINGYIFLAPYLGPMSDINRKHDNIGQSFVKKVRTWVYILNHFVSFNWLKHIKSVYFNYPQDLLESDPLIVPAYTYTMSCATSPYDPKNLFENLEKPFAIFASELDEQFIPEKTVKYLDLAKKVQDKSTAEIVPGAKHISILLEAPELINKAIRAL